jgi:hypothetical protein
VNGKAKRERFLQIFDGSSLDALLKMENSFLRRLARMVFGIPIYSDHPDLPTHSPETLVNSPGPKVRIGVIRRLRKSPRGLEAHCVLNPAGKMAVKNGRRFPSVFWSVQLFGNRRGTTLARPSKLLSVGLVNRPNIPGVDFIAAQAA